MGPVGFSVEQQNLIWAMWRRGDAIREMERTLGETLPRIRRYLRQWGGIPPIPRQRRANQLSLAEREEISRGIAAGLSARRSRGGSTDRRRRYRGKSPAMVGATPTGHWSPTRRHSSGRGARNQASSRPTRSYVVWSPTSWTTTGHRSRSPSGWGGSLAATRRCRSPMNRSTATCICRRGKCLTPVCSTACEATVRSDGRAERSVHTVAARSGIWSPSASGRPRPIPGR